MVQSSGFVSERHSLLSSSEPASGSASPLVIKPAAVMPHKPRSSSMNSNGSTASNHARSLSIISLESPRNSIVSLEDGFARTSRNGSNVSLSSLLGNNGVKTPPLGSSRETLRPGHKTVPKLNNTAITSDEDSEAEQKSVIHYSKQKERNTELGTPTYVKKDFEFQYGATIPKYSTATQKTIVLDTKQSYEYTPPPLLLETDTEVLKDRTEKTITKKSKAVNNNKTNRIHQSIYLKKKLIYSKDLQLELLNSNGITERHLETRFVESAPSNMRTTHTNTNTAHVKEFEKQPIIATLEHQNKLITKLNEKWNKSLMNVIGASGSDNKQVTDTGEPSARSRKRSREYLFGDDEDSYVDYHN